MMLNARFLPDPRLLLTDLRDGPRYPYNGVMHTLPWSTTYEELARLPFVRKLPHHAFGWPVYFVDVPLRLGMLEVDGIEINRPDMNPSCLIRNDVPVDGYEFEVRLTEPGTEGYWQLRAYFEQTLGKPTSSWDYPKDQVHAQWLYDGLRISLTYWFRSTVKRSDWDYTSLSITNERIYPDYLTDTYTNQFRLETDAVQYKTYKLPYLSIPHNYRTSRYVRLTPATLQRLLEHNRHTLAVWFDAPAQKLGIALATYALMIPVPDAPRLRLETIDLDRGQYADELTLTGLPDGSQLLASADVGKLNALRKTLQEWLYSRA